ncbi:hypothetical protein ACHQM5_029146 [Ranunculus cassubicifolius]
MAMQESKTISSVRYIHVEEVMKMETLWEPRFSNTSSFIGSEFRSSVGDDSSRVMTVKRNEEVNIDERAEAFITKFRQQLRVERLNSFGNYKNILERGF